MHTIYAYRLLLLLLLLYVKKILFPSILFEAKGFNVQKGAIETLGFSSVAIVTPRTCPRQCSIYCICCPYASYNFLQFFLTGNV